MRASQSDGQDFPAATPSIAFLSARRFGFGESERQYSAYFDIEQPEKVNVDRLGWNSPPVVPQ
jgi:hypothetical protein